jgi:hypothetical protein
MLCSPLVVTAGTLASAQAGPVSAASDNRYEVSISAGIRHVGGTRKGAPDVQSYAIPPRCNGRTLRQVNVWAHDNIGKKKEGILQVGVYDADGRLLYASPFLDVKKAGSTLEFTVDVRIERGYTIRLIAGSKSA